MIRRIVTAVLIMCGIALGQSSSAPTNLRAFDVVSIRPSKPGTGMRTSWVTTPDGYSVTGQSMLATILMAYFPQGWFYWSKDRVSGAPAWLTDQYDINAKVSDADLAEWQKQGARQSSDPRVALDKKPMFREMLQTMLAYRCHFVAHMVPGRAISGWAIELGKHPPRLTESKPGKELPAGVRLNDGGVNVSHPRGDKARLTIYAATVADLAQILSAYAHGHPVQDHTGLTGHYDFVVDWVSDPDSKLPDGLIAPDDPDPLSHWNIEALGFSHVPIKIPVDTLVIDHIEKPSEN